nr:hypothetical protein [uncultured Mediterranean phage uvMED]
MMRSLQVNDLTPQELSVIDDALHSRLRSLLTDYSLPQDHRLIKELRSVQVKVQSRLGEHYTLLFKSNDREILNKLKEEKLQGNA